MTTRILIVDDSMFMRKLLHSILKKEGYVIVGEARSGREAVEEYLRLLPDIVTLDLTMPEMNGLEATKAICKDYPTAKIIIVSAMGQKGIVTEAMKAGAKDFIVKPFNAVKVIEAIQRVL